MQAEAPVPDPDHVVPDPNDDMWTRKKVETPPDAAFKITSYELSPETLQRLTVGVDRLPVNVMTEMTKTTDNVSFMDAVEFMTAVGEAARMAHEVNRAYCESLGYTSQVPWNDAPEWQRASAMEGAIAIASDPDRTPEQSHEGWMEHKAKDGWVYGEVKDADAKTHPCMVPYAELPADQRLKDTLFGAVVRASLETGLQGLDVPALMASYRKHKQSQSD